MHAMRDMGVICGSAEQAKALIVGVDTVYVHSDIKPIREENGEELFQYHEIQYGKDEYIQLISEKNSTLEKQITDTQLALCEVDLCQYFGQKKSKDYAAFLSSSSSFC